MADLTSSHPWRAFYAAVWDSLGSPAEIEDRRQRKLACIGQCFSEGATEGRLHPPNSRTPVGERCFCFREGAPTWEAGTQ